MWDWIIDIIRFLVERKHRIYLFYWQQSFLLSCRPSKCLYRHFLFLLISATFPPKALCIFVGVCACVPNPRFSLLLVTQQISLQNILSRVPWSRKILWISFQVSISGVTDGFSEYFDTVYSPNVLLYEAWFQSSWVADHWSLINLPIFRQI